MNADFMLETIEEAERALSRLKDALEGTKIAGWDFSDLEEELDEIKSSAEEVLAQERADTEELVSWEWTHR